MISGPTAVGKTSVSIELARYFNCPIVSADSRQFYREMSIGTAKPTPKELAASEHYFINSHSVETPVSAGEYERIALNKISELHKEHKVVILTGGSGLFIDAVCKGFDRLPKTDSDLRAELNGLYKSEGLSALQAKLKAIDSDYYTATDFKNPHRVIRAIELCLSSGKKMAELQQKTEKKRPFEIVYLALQQDREVLYERINDRVDFMMEQGLEQEVRNLVSKRNLMPLKTVGYSELFSYFDGKIGKTEAVALIKRNSRRYAKRQLTWLRRNEKYKWFEPTEIHQIIKYILSNIQ